MAEPSLRTLNEGRGAVRPGRKAALFLCAVLAVEGLAGCGPRHKYSQKHVDCYNGVCGPLRLEVGEKLRVRLPNGSEVMVEPQEGESCVKVTVPDGRAAEVERNRMLRPEVVRAMEERGRRDGTAP